MKIFISGGTGFFGKAILRFLSDKYLSCPFDFPEVIVLSRSPDAFLNANPVFKGFNWLRLHKGDIQNPSSFPTKERFTHVLHAATDSTNTNDLTLLQRYEQITEGTKNLLQFSVSTGAKRFLLTSSGAVYGPQPADMYSISESLNSMPDPLNPYNVYGIAKRQAEHLCIVFSKQYGIETVIARCFSFIGEDLPLSAHFAIGNFIRDALFGNQLIVRSDGSAVRTYLHQSELAQWLMELLYRDYVGPVYNVGSTEVVTIKDLAHLVRDALSPNKEIIFSFSKEINNTSYSRYVPDVSRARIDLGLIQKIFLPEAIEMTAKAIKSSR